MKTVFIRAIEAAVDEKAVVIRAAVHGLGTARYEADTKSFGQIPRSPFAYWTNDAIRACFTSHLPLEHGQQVARRGPSTCDDFRYLRCSWEVPFVREHRPGAWIPFAKGGAFSRYYADIYLLVDWEAGRATFLGFFGRPGRWIDRPESVDFFFRPGLTWPRRTQGGLSLRVMPEGCIFADKGPAAFVDGDDPSKLLVLAAITNSRAFAALVEMQMAFGSYEVGVIQRTPVPEVVGSDVGIVAALARRSWSLKRRLDTRIENSHAFLLPALLQVEADRLIDRAQAWGQVTADAQAELDALAAEIDDHAYRLYGISAEDRQRIEQGFDGGGEADETPDDDDGDETDEEVAEVDAAPMVASLFSWSLGVAFGRFDMRLATGEREAPPEPEPFDPLPVCSPGMLTGEDGLPVAAPPSGYPLSFPMDGILVDDPGHPRDVVPAVRQVFETVFDDANARWHEAAELLGAPDLRRWFARDFFEPHIKRYSKSRRKAPIYWQLATASGSYSVWIYIHRATGDTLFRVLNDFIGPKLDHEKAKLAQGSGDRVQGAGGTTAAAQRRELEQQETFVGELQALKTEVARVAPLWKPNLDDGVILNFAPLWRLVPQSRSWQGECKKAWDKLVAGDYDWAHLAMHLWPERVVKKCIDDRSLAIAHGLDRVLGSGDRVPGTNTDATPSGTLNPDLRTLINERTSTTVKAALKDLLSAPAARAQGSGSRKRKPSTANGGALSTRRRV